MDPHTRTELVVHLELPRTSLAPALARRSLHPLRDQLEPGRLEDLRLLVSELVTNSVRHSGAGEDAWIRITYSLYEGGSLRVEVTDPGPGFPQADADAEQPEPATDEVSGRGLYIVRSLSDRWGVEGNGVTRVWFELGPKRLESQPCG